MQGRNGDLDKENKLVDTLGEREGGQIERVALKLILPCVKQIAKGKSLCSRERSLVLCDDLEGWDGVEVRKGWGGGFKREETCVYVWLIHVDVWQKPTQHCKAIILQFKINKCFKSSSLGTC